MTGHLTALEMNKLPLRHLS